MDRPSFEQLIKEDRAARESKVWRGSFLEYLDLVREDPSLPKLAHARIFDNIMRSGTLDIQESDDPRVKRLYKDESFKVYNFFRDEFFGIEKTVAQIVRYFHSASLKGEESRQVLYLMGPVGSGKSSLVERLQRGLEASEPFYAIENCPMAEEPLHLIPRHLRKEFEKMLGVHIEGDLCPVCRFRLKEEYGGRYEEVPVSTRFFSKRNRIGIGVVPPVDPVILAHSNEAEWQKFKADHTNEAILDRIVVVKVPYNLRLSEEVKIYQKIIRLSDFRAHVAPHTLEIASMFAILSRLEPNAKCDLVTKLKLYNGEELLEKEITKAFVYSYQEQAESLFQNYLDHAEAFVNKTRVKDRNTKEELQPDEGFLKSIEEQIAIIGSAAEGFRQEVIAYLWASSRRGERVSYRSYEPLKEAIEKKLMTSVRDISRIITKARTRDEEQTAKYNAMVKNLLDSGYCESCVDVVLKYAANNLWKD